MSILNFDVIKCALVLESDIFYDCFEKMLELIHLEIYKICLKKNHSIILHKHSLNADSLSLSHSLSQSKHQPAKKNQHNL